MGRDLIMDDAISPVFQLSSNNFENRIKVNFTTPLLFHGREMYSAPSCSPRLEHVSVKRNESYIYALELGTFF